MDLHAGNGEACTGALEGRWFGSPGSGEE
jgi:hypothetical protein